MGIRRKDTAVGEYTIVCWVKKTSKPSSLMVVQEKIFHDMSKYKVSRDQHRQH